MSKNYEKKETIKWVVAIVIIIAISGGLNWLMSYLYAETGLLIFYFFSVWYNDSLGVVVFFLMVVIFGVYETKKDGEKCNIKKVFLVFSVIALIYMMFVNVFEVSKRYGAVLIDNDTPSRFTYKYNILLDAIEEKTITEAITVDNIKTYTNHYVARSGKSSRSAKSYYIRFTIGDNQYSSLESYELARYINMLMSAENTITIEYYPRTGIIKTIDGIDKNDSATLERYAIRTQNEARIEKQKQEQESVKQEEEERANSVIEFTILNNSIGKSIEDVEAELTEQNIAPSYKTIYISSQMYAINKIAFYDDDILYIVNDNSHEDLVAFPNIDEGMTKEQIVSILTDLGLSYKCDEFECDMHGTNRLHTKGYSTGTYIPKQHRVWFSVDK